MQRIYKWDNLKFILILLVVIGHFFESYSGADPVFAAIKYFIYSFHMPLFIFVSGMFSKKTVNADRLESRRVAPYFLLAIVLKVLFYFMHMILGDTPSFSITRESGLPWYLIAVGTWLIITHLIKNISPVYILSASVFVGLAAGLDSNLGAEFCASRILVFYPFFLLGYYLDGESVIRFTSKPSVRAASVAVVAAVAVAAVSFSNGPHTFSVLLSGQHSYSEMPAASQYGALIRLALYIVSTLMCFAVIALTPGKKMLISPLGARTLQVYSLHYLVIFVLAHFEVFPRLCKINVPTATVLYTLMAVVLTFLLSAGFISKPFNALFRPKERKI